MLQLPEWAPNVHPIIVHFPVALLPLAVFMDLIAVLVRKKVAVHAAAVAVYVMGAIGALAAYLTGKAAADGFDLPSDLIPHVTDHADSAELTLWFFGIYAVLRIAYFWWSRRRPTGPAWVHVPLFVIGAGGLALLVRTGDLGAQLVFEHGVGVQAVERSAADSEPAIARGMEARLQMDEAGAWRVVPGLNASDLFEDALTFVQGSSSDLAVGWAENDSSLVINAGGDPTLFTAGGAIESVEVRAQVRLDEFDGFIRLVHHVQDAKNYHFLEIRDDLIQQGLVENGSVEILDEAAVDAAGWIDARAVADGTHFRGYLGSELVTHPHASAPEAGPAGLYLNGEGIVYLRTLRASSLR